MTLSLDGYLPLQQNLLSLYSRTFAEEPLHQQPLEQMAHPLEQKKQRLEQKEQR